MTGALSPWWNGVGSGESFTLKVERAGQPPLPWTWEIVGGGGKAGAHRSLRGYRAAEEAWTAGRVALADMERSGRPGAPTAEQRTEIARKTAGRRNKG